MKFKPMKNRCSLVQLEIKWQTSGEGQTYLRRRLSFPFSKEYGAKRLDQYSLFRICHKPLKLTVFSLHSKKLRFFSFHSKNVDFQWRLLKTPVCFKKLRFFAAHLYYWLNNLHENLNHFFRL